MSLIKKITFTITAEEVQQYSAKKLSKREIQEILLGIENDHVLWDKIEEAILASIDTVISQ